MADSQVAWSRRSKVFMDNKPIASADGEW